MMKHNRKRGSSRMKENGFVRLELWLDEALHERIYQIARAECTTKARIVKECLENWAFGFKFLTTKQLAELAKDELNNVR